jgi:hypothetical protein
LKRPTVWLGVLFVLCATVVGLLASPPQDAGRGPQGIAALRRYLPAMGLETVDQGEPPAPGEGTFFLLADIRDEEGAEKIKSWVRSGGRLVLTEPQSLIVAELDTEKSDGGLESILPGSRRLVPRCDAFEGTGVDELVVALSDASLEAPSGADGCFSREGRPYLAIFDHGEGQVLVMAGTSPFTNQYLRSGDNAVFAYRLFAGFGPVVFGPPVDPAAQLSGSPWQSLPAGARSSLAILVLAAVVFAAVSGRRFGKPLVEQPISPIASSQLVGATAGLYQSARTRGFAADLLRRGSARRICRMLGLPSGTEVDAVRAVAGGAVGGGGALTQALGEFEPSNDEELIELARRLHQLEKAVEAL